MEIDILPWMSLAVRWLHLIAGIAWIGSSFYFIWLDNSLRPEANEKEPGVSGGLWAVHGGGFYHKKKFQVAPKHLPDHLHWFKWEAYVTWLSGIGLMILMYYWQADLYLIDPLRADLSQLAAISVGVGFLIIGWIIYDIICRLTTTVSSMVSGALWFGFLILSTYILVQVFSDRGAFLHVGAMIGTAMAGNVFFVIIPNQKVVVASMLAGETPDPKLLVMAKQRSVHNNYMTLPVLLIMVSTHYPNLTGHHLNWLLLALLSLSGVLIRHFFNLRHKDKVVYPILFAGFGLFIATMIFAAATVPKTATHSGKIDFSQVEEIVQRHCTACHSANPTHARFDEAPMGLILDTREQFEQFSSSIYDQVVVGKTMPLGSATPMSDEERQVIGNWIEQQKKK
ncbi:MAG: urate hydroxylase PuuD [Robiginitomaculum sp.]|nr:urate hydroxylase PuuD [Robiginitomaculum sp.]